MNRRKLFRCILIQLLVFVLVLSSFQTAAGAENASGTNRFNVAVVLDASGSMQNTDPKGYRFEAIRQFTNLLAEQGNTLGGVVFNTGIVGGQELAGIHDQAGKDSVIHALESASAKSGWTNIGAGLSRAVEMINAHGDPSLPSVILFLSDGNTDMGGKDETQKSLDLKANAIQAARENGIATYSACLNANQEADIAEMEQISAATGGVFLEVTAAEDLQDVFNTFYELIYGTTTIPLYSGVFPDSGKLETKFDVPGLGVEEVNIIAYGATTTLTLYRPDGTPSDASRQDGGTFSMLKLTDVIPGTWSLITEGVPNDDIKINMVYNANLGIQVGGIPAGQTVSPEDSVTITATLTENNIAANNSQQYVGYSAELLVMDAYGDHVESTPMRVVNDHFEAVRSFEEGTYYYKVAVSGNYIEKTSESFGPLVSTVSTASEPARANTPPTPVSEVVEATVNIWPFRSGSYTLDLNTLASDAEDDTLKYKIISTSFRENSDYTVDAGSVLHMEQFSLSKGSFTIRAIDSGGLYCDVEVIVRTINIGLVTLAGLAALALLAAAVCGILLYIALSKPFRGTISAQSYCNGTFRGTPRSPKRGRCKLSAFGMDNVGLDYQKSYFQATGKNYIELYTNTPVIWNGQETKRVRIASGAETTLTIRQGDPRLLYVRFDSRMTGRARRGGRPKRR